MIFLAAEATVGKGATDAPLFLASEKPIWKDTPISVIGNSTLAYAGGIEPDPYEVPFDVFVGYRPFVTGPRSYQIKSEYNLSVGIQATNVSGTNYLKTKLSPVFVGAGGEIIDDL